MAVKDEALDIIIEKAAMMFGVDPSTLGPETNFKEDLQCKSANMVQFTTALEDEFDIEVPYMEFSKKATFADAAEFVVELCDE